MGKFYILCYAGSWTRSVAFNLQPMGQIWLAEPCHLAHGAPMGLEIWQPGSGGDKHCTTSLPPNVQALKSRNHASVCGAEAMDAILYGAQFSTWGQGWNRDLIWCRGLRPCSKQALHAGLGPSLDPCTSLGPGWIGPTCWTRPMDWICSANNWTHVVNCCPYM